MPTPDEPRQAVVIIHGIGEQIPMQTLRTFVGSVTGHAHPDIEFSPRAESKPDFLSPTLELRRIAVLGECCAWEPGKWVATDFYELYWAHLMTGTAWHHVTAWFARLLLRSPCVVPSRLKVAWWTCWIIVVAAFALLVLLLGPMGPQTAALWSALGTFGVLLIVVSRQISTYLGVKYAGDAARYLSPRPENVGVRQTIRSAAVELLEKLHDDPSWRRYHRIVVVGHSLGSVIAYDALTHLWQRRHHPHREDAYPPSASEPRTAERYKDSLRDGVTASNDEDVVRELQAAMWREQREMGVQWKITDLVTLGSPLAHAPFLMASNGADFERRKEQREYPTCPPQPNDIRDQLYGRSLLTAPRGGSLVHHAAMFACTRWTNLYFDRDLIGGKIGDLGKWINNPRLEPRGFLPHTAYWKSGADHSQLNKALDLTDWWKLDDNRRVALEAQKREDEARRRDRKILLT